MLVHGPSGTVACRTNETRLNAKVSAKRFEIMIGSSFWGLEFRGLGFRGLGFRSSGFRVQGFRV